MTLHWPLICFVVYPLQHTEKVNPVVENGVYATKPKIASTENGILSETQDKDAASDGLGSVAVYDQWIVPPTSGQCPRARYEVLDLRCWAWSRVEAGFEVDSAESQPSRPLAPCAGHSLTILEAFEISAMLDDLKLRRGVELKARDQEGSSSVAVSFSFSDDPPK
ncbi:hypothetical protein NL676_030824 [Syzygium grande]|nr:hypothetical protein NL676_030824 [Syzygium grande]